MNIIFLDIDGVLNCTTFYEERQKRRNNGEIMPYPYDEICYDRVKWLEELCKELNAKIVISSTWRKSGIEYCRDVLQKFGATFEIIDITPDFQRRDYLLRGNEILAWIQKNETLLGCPYHNFTTYAILDDDSDMLYWQRNNLFLTDRYSGLTPDMCYRIKRFFHKYD